MDVIKERTMSDSTDITEELIVSRRGELPQFYRATKTLVTIGRDETNDIPLNQHAISRNHARLQKRNGLWYITDLNSTNGTYLGSERLPSNAPQIWRTKYPIQIGSYVLQWQTQKHSEDRTLMLLPEQIDENLGRKAGIVDDQINLALNIPTLELEVNSSKEVRIGILSLSQLTIKELKIQIEGIPTTWYTLGRSEAVLQPKKHILIPLTFHIPQQENSAGTHEYEVILHDVHDPMRISRTTGKLIVSPVSDFDFKLYSGYIINSGELHFILENIGNTEDSYKIEVESKQKEVIFSDKSWEVTLPPGKSELIHCLASAESRPFFGANTARPFSIVAHSRNGQKKQIDTQLEISPTINFELVVLSALIIIVLIALIILLLG